MSTIEPLLRDVTLARGDVTSWEVYPFCIPAVARLERLALHPKVTYFIGENGSGKSTILEAIAVHEGYNAEGGSRNFQFETRPSHSQLSKYIHVRRSTRGRSGSDGYFFRAESFYNLATEVDRIGDARFLRNNYGGKSLHEQSHGESFFALLDNRFRGNGLYLLDEPESALSPLRQMSLLTLIHDLTRAGSQFIIATHSPIVMAYPDATIYRFSENGIDETQYTATEHYKVTKSFLSRYERMLEELLAD